MRNGNGKELRNSSFEVDALEDRRLMAASPLFAGGGPGKVWDDAPPAVVMPAAAAPKARQVQAPKVTNVVGTWTGTAKTTATGQFAAISVKFDKQSGVAATGNFSFGPITGNATVRSTAVLSTRPDRGISVIFRTKTTYSSVTAALSADGKQIIGKWAYNGPGGWKTGTLVLTRG